MQAKVGVKGVQINYDKVGSGGHPVLCMPGALGFIESDFGPILPKFDTKAFTVITWDPPGYGKSRPPDRDFSGLAEFFHRDAKFANDFMKTLGYSKYSVLGWSDGGNTGMVMGFKYPESIRKLVLWGGNSYITQADVDLYKQVENVDNWSPRMKAPMIEMYGEEYFRRSWSAWTKLFLDIFHHSQGDICKEGVKQINAPTLIIHGMKDAMVPFEHADYLHKNIKGSILHVMKEGKHNLHIRYSDEFIKLVESFLKE